MKFICINTLRDVYSTPNNISIKPKWKGFEVEQILMKIIPRVQQISINFFTDNIGNSSDFFGPLFVGDDMFKNADYCIDKAVEYMKSGRPSFLQNRYADSINCSCSQKSS